MGLADLLAAEKAAVAAGGTACGYTCACHGNHTCERLVHPQDEAPHVATLPDSTLIQWSSAECLTAEQVTQAAQESATARQDYTHGIVATLDPQLLVQLLVQGGYVSPVVIP